MNVKEGQLLYIFQNALRSIGRSLGRNLLIGIIVLMIAATACIGLSIRRAADNAKETGLEGMSVTASVSMDIRSMMDSAMDGEGGFDRENFSGQFDELESVGLEELQIYAEAESVSNFYYTLTLGVDGTDDFEAVTNTFEAPTDETVSQEGAPELPEGMGGGMNGGKGGMMGGMFQSSCDFSIIGYSSDAAMTDFTDGTASIVAGVVFDEGTEELVCILPTELATFNGITVGDTVTVSNPENENEIYTLTVVGTYETEDGGNVGFGGGRGSFGASDPTNRIYMSAAAVNAIVSASETLCAESETTALSTTADGTYVFADVDAYEAFEDEARALGMPASYTVSSTDVTAFEQQLVPLETLSTFAQYFLLIVLAIGAIILIVLNLFNIRERKYEVGVLTAIGMKKGKVALQFVCETLIVTVLAVMIGGAAGAVAAVPVSNVLLEQQVNSQQADLQRTEDAFGRGGMGGMATPPQDGDISQMPDDIPQGGGMFEQFRDDATSYITEIHAAADWVVLLQLLGIALLLSVVASLVSVIFIMRYDPLRILANRD